MAPYPGFGWFDRLSCLAILDVNKFDRHQTNRYYLQLTHHPWYTLVCPAFAQLCLSLESLRLDLFPTLAFLCFSFNLQLGLIRRDRFVLNAFSVEEAVGVIRQAFSSFDKDGKGFVSATDISRVLAESGEGNLSEEVCIETSSA